MADLGFFLLNKTLKSILAFSHLISGWLAAQSYTHQSEAIR